MFNPVIVDKINEVEKGRRERQVAAIQLINQAHNQRNQFPNPLKLLMRIIAQLGKHRPEALPPQKASAELKLSED